MTNIIQKCEQSQHCSKNNLIIFDDSSPCLTIINLTICTVLIDWISNYFISHTFSQGTNVMA